jgi:hypothetical protein
MTQRLVSGLFAILLLTSAPAWAQTTGWHASGRDVRTEPPRKKAGRAAQKSCPEYGPGFVRVEGSSSCVRVGGAVSVDVGTGR